MSILVPPAAPAEHGVVKLSGARTGGRLAVVEIPLRPGTMIAPHVHDHEICVYGLAGRVGIRVADETVVVTPGAYAHKPRGVPHAMWNGEAEPARVIEIVSPAGFDRFIEEVQLLYPDDEEAFTALAARYGLRFLGDWPGEPGWVERTRASFRP